MKTPNKFNPTICKIGDSRWTASMKHPLLGQIMVSGDSYAVVKVNLWLIVEAINDVEQKLCADPKDWTPEQWRSALKTMKSVCGADEAGKSGAVR